MDTPPDLLSASDWELLHKAQEATGFSYAPHSKFYVGAALISQLGRLYTGCNVENKSLGLTICAERNAIFHAISVEGPAFKIASIAVVERSNPPCSPCGACLQVIKEFSLPTTILLFNGQHRIEKQFILNLLPFGF